jgi:hypothetical protein
VAGPDEQVVKVPPPDRARLAAHPPDISNVPAGRAVGRIFMAGGDHPTTWNGFRFWGPTGSRFDPHVPDPVTEGGMVQARGVMYGSDATAADPPGALAVCLAEVYQTTRLVDRAGRAASFAVFETTRPLRLVDLRSAWITRVGASAAIAACPRALSRPWARAIYEAYPDIDGLRYGSSMAANAPMMALFERAADALPDRPVFIRPLVDPSMTAPLDHAAARIGYGLI